MTETLKFTALDDVELATIVGGLAPLLITTLAAGITVILKDFVDHVGDFAGGLKDGWTAAAR